MEDFLVLTPQHGTELFSEHSPGTQDLTGLRQERTPGRESDLGEIQRHWTEKKPGPPPSAWGGGLTAGDISSYLEASQPDSHVIRPSGLHLFHPLTWES